MCNISCDSFYNLIHPIFSVLLNYLNILQLTSELRPKLISIIPMFIFLPVIFKIHFPLQYFVAPYDMFSARCLYLSSKSRGILSAVSTHLMV